MRKFVLKSASALSALAIVVSAAACSRAPGEDVALNDTNNKAAVQPVKSSATFAAEKRAAAAEARARTAEANAEARIQCERDRQAASNRGAVVGGITGAVVGSQVAGSGAKSEGGAIGGVAGVLAGRQIAKKDHRC